MKEFVDIEDFPGYKISKDGVVIGLKGHPLTQQLNVDGYPVVYMRKSGKNCCVRVHRLLAKAFIPHKEGCDIVNHIDGNKENYSLENLEWTTVQGNVDHAITVLGKKHLPNVSLNEDTVRLVCKLIQEGVSQKQIIKLTGVSQSVVNKISRRKVWTSISQEYVFEERVGKLLKSEVMAIVELLNNGYTVREVVEHINRPDVTKDAVAKIASFKTYKELTSGILKSREERSSTRAKARTLK